MKAYEDLDLPALPDPWVWVCGILDGDPYALRRKHGSCIRVHEAQACRYSEDIAITVSRDPDWTGDYYRSLPGAPFSVFEAVYRAVRQWYEVDAKSEES